jgi:hypothetical protein
MGQYRACVRPRTLSHPEPRPQAKLPHLVLCTRVERSKTNLVGCSPESSSGKQPSPGLQGSSWASHPDFSASNPNMWLICYLPHARASLSISCDQPETGRSPGGRARSPTQPCACECVLHRLSFHSPATKRPGRQVLVGQTPHAKGPSRQQLESHQTRVLRKIQAPSQDKSATS